MDIEKLFKLLDAGFTKDEIIKLVSTTVVQAEPVEPEAPAAAPDPAPAVAPAKPIESSPAWAEQLIRSNENLTAAIKSINLLNSSVPAPAGDDITQVLASIIDPEGSTMKERK